MPDRFWLVAVVVATLSGCHGADAHRQDAAATNEKSAQQQRLSRVPQRLLDARAAYVQGHYSETIRIARSALDHPQQAWRMIGASSCFLKDRDQATEAWNNLDRPGRAFLEWVCLKNMIMINPGKNSATNEELAEQQRLTDALTAFGHGNCSESIRIARSLSSSSLAWRLIGASSCCLKDREQATEAWNNLDPEGRLFVKEICSHEGHIVIP
jgi:hypothetical protein